MVLLLVESFILTSACPSCSRSEHVLDGSFVLAKSHPFGNKYQIICCDMSGIMLTMEMVEYKDRSQEEGNAEFDDYGENNAGLLHLCRFSFHSARYAVLESRFCILKALVECIFAVVLIKR